MMVSSDALVLFYQLIEIATSTAVTSWQPPQRNDNAAALIGQPYKCHSRRRIEIFLVRLFFVQIYDIENLYPQKQTF